MGKGCNDVYRFVDQITPETAKDMVLVIPLERAEDVIQFARMQLEDDIKTRGDHYQKLGFAADDTLKWLD